MHTPEELNQYIRLTLKQHKIKCDVVWDEGLTDTLGLADGLNNRIQLSPRICCSFTLFNEVFLHELAHISDFLDRGNYKRNGRNDFHGENWKKHCAALGVRARRLIPCSI